MLTEWLDASYSAFKVPIGIATYQDYSSFGVLSCLDIIAGQDHTSHVVCLQTLFSHVRVCLT